MLKTLLKKRGAQISLVVGIFAIAMLVLNTTLLDFQTNLIAGKKAAPYDGLSLPIKKAPNWVELTSNQWDWSYGQLPENLLIDLPQYDPNQLKKDPSSLNWSNQRDKMIRNAQVTFSVPYMGNYKLDGREFVGSHLAVDIKIPINTPVFAIGNGVVTKVSPQSSGFGQHIVVRHDDFPSVNNPNVKETYYSSYSHLSNIHVSEGDIVTKGQKIGLSGQSGTATTPHLHFQIDNSKAPWHPYWPFTYSEANAAGLSFFEAINTGLGQDKAIETTINPMLYVQKYLDDSGQSQPAPDVEPVSEPVSEAEPVKLPERDEEPEAELPTTIGDLPPDITVSTPDASSDSSEVAKVEEVAVVEEVEEEKEKPESLPLPELAEFELRYDDSLVLNQPKKVKVVAFDEDGKVFNSYKPDDVVYIKIENGSAELSTKFLDKSDFVMGIAEFEITPTAEFGLRFSVSEGKIQALSDVMQSSIFTDLDANDDRFTAINFLKNNNVIRGYPDGSFKPDNPVSRVEALKFIYEGLNKDYRKTVVLEFADTDSKAWYARYIGAAQQQGIVKGYEGNVFKPGNTVTRAEFLKMLLLSAEIDVEDYEVRRKPYVDVNFEDWHIKYIAKAKEMNLLADSSNKIGPNEPLERGEVSEILYKLIITKVNGKDSYSNSLVVDNSDIEGFYN